MKQITITMEERLNDILENGLKYEPLVPEKEFLNFSQERTHAFEHECRVQEIKERNKQDDLEFKMWDFVVELLHKSNSIVVDKLLGDEFPTEVKISDLTISFKKMEEVLEKYFSNNLIKELEELKDNVFRGDIGFALKLYKELRGE